MTEIISYLNRSTYTILPVFSYLPLIWFNPSRSSTSVMLRSSSFRIRMPSLCSVPGSLVKCGNLNEQSPAWEHIGTGVPFITAISHFNLVLSSCDYTNKVRSISAQLHDFSNFIRHSQRNSRLQLRCENIHN